MFVAVTNKKNESFSPLTTNLAVFGSFVSFFLVALTRRTRTPRRTKQPKKKTVSGFGRSKNVQDELRVLGSRGRPLSRTTSNPRTQPVEDHATRSCHTTKKNAPLTPSPPAYPLSTKRGENTWRSRQKHHKKAGKNTDSDSAVVLAIGE